MREIVAVELAAVKEFHELAGLASLELLKTFDLAHKRGRCVCGRKPAETETRTFPHAKGRRERGGYGLLKGRLISWLNARFFCAGLL